MSKDFEGQGVPSGSENPKEVKPMSEEYGFFMASVALSEVKKSEPGMSDEKALDYVVEHTGVDKAGFTAWLEALKEDKAPIPAPVRAPAPTPRRGRRYTEEDRKGLWFNNGPMA